jgi:hypothetical protein
MLTKILSSLSHQTLFGRRLQRIISQQVLVLLLLLEEMILQVTAAKIVIAAKKINQNESLERRDM